MVHRLFAFTLCLFIAVICTLSGKRFLIGAGDGPDAANSVPAFAGQNTTRSAVADDKSAGSLGIEFVKGSTSAVIVRHNGKKYLVDLVTHSIRKIDPPTMASVSTQTQPAPQSALAGQQPNGAALFEHNCATCHGPDGKGVGSLKTPDFTNPAVLASLTDAQMTGIIENGKPGTMMPAWRNKLSADEIEAVQTFVRSLSAGSKPGGELAQQAAANPKRKIYTPGDDVLFALPTGRPIAKHGLYVNFAHRFPYFATFSDPASGGALGGLDSSALPSFGFRYGVTDRLSVSIYREPSLMGRPIQFLGVYDLMEEEKGGPFNVAVGFAVQGQNNFSTNYTESLEGIFSKSLSSRAQLYLVPTLSFNNRPLQQVGTFFSSGIPSLPGYNTFSLGVGGALDIRPTVALVAEVIPTLANGRPLGILRPAFSFGIQKKIWRHAFTFGWTTAPGVTVAERAGTRASFLGQPNADTFGGLFIGFDLTRRLF
jgi:mono/diheme cytochrome c family protein